MKIAVMQPYFFPYIGYFQLIQAVDEFVFFDDVNFIKKGWIHRNNILVNNIAHRFTIPLKKASQNKLIHQVYVSEDHEWKEKLKKTLYHAYKDAPYFNQIFHLFSATIDVENKSISEFAVNSVISVLDYLDMKKDLILSSSLDYSRNNVTAQQKIISICDQLRADHYVNPINGQSLYHKDEFYKQSISLSFIKTSKSLLYKQGESTDFVPNLSMIDVLMYNSIDNVKHLLKMYDLI